MAPEQLAAEIERARAEVFRLECADDRAALNGSLGAAYERLARLQALLASS
jgi:hypothetical protein